MAITNIFNKEKRERNGKKTSNPAKSAAKAGDAKKETAVAVKKTEKTVAKDNAGIYRIIRNPHITEKATMLAEINQYVFKIFDNVNKTEIRKAVEDYYGVDVVAVRMVNIPSRTKKRGKGVAIKQGYKKAIVVVAKGQAIEVLPR